MEQEPNWAELNESGWRFTEDPLRLTEHFSDLADKYPTSGRAKFELANVLDYLGEEAQAVPLYEEAISFGLSEEYEVYAKLQLGSSLRSVGRFEEAVSLLRDSVSQYPGTAAMRMFLGLALHSNGQSSEALQVSLQALLQHLDSNDVERYRPALENYVQEIGHENSQSPGTSHLETLPHRDSADILIRPLGETDQPPMELLLLADPSEKLVNGYLKRGRCWVAEAKDEVIGVYVLVETRPETVELVNVAVRGDMQGRGIGKLLVVHAVKTARELGFRTVELGTGNSSVHQLRLYQKCGFRIIGVDTDFFVRYYDEPIYENGIQCRDMIRLMQDL